MTPSLKSLLLALAVVVMVALVVMPVTAYICMIITMASAVIVGSFALGFITTQIILSIFAPMWEYSSIVTIACGAATTTATCALMYAQYQKPTIEHDYEYWSRKHSYESAYIMCTFFFFLVAALSIYLYTQIRPLGVSEYFVFVLIGGGEIGIVLMGISSAIDSWRLDHPKKKVAVLPESICNGAKP